MKQPEKNDNNDNRIETVPLPDTLAADEVLIRVLAAPINPSDVNTIQGVYGKEPSSFPANAGLEGVAIIEQVGDKVTNVKVNQRVIPAQPGAFSTWRTHGVAKASDLTTVSDEIPAEYAAVLSVNPCTAYRLLNDFANLKSGDVVIQNGASTMVGISVIQMAKDRGIKTINIVQDGASESTITQLKDLGADIVVTESYANSANMKKLVSDLPKAKLALNCVGGPAARAAVRFLAEKGTMVTYGGLSMQPVSIPTSPFIFNDVTLKGFWLTRWVENNSKEARQKMLDDVAQLIKQKKLTLFTETFKFENFDQAIEASQQSGRSRKAVLKME